jgi:CRISPR-associated protein Cas1
LKRQYYIFSSGKLSRKENTIFLYPSSTGQHAALGKIDAEEEKMHEKPEYGTAEKNDDSSFDGEETSQSYHEVKEDDSRDGTLEMLDEQDKTQTKIGDIDQKPIMTGNEQASSGEESGHDENAGQIPKKVIPVEDVDSIYIFGEISLNTKFLNFASQNQIPIHVFNYYGFYSGSYYPREFLNSGFLLVKQVEHYTDPAKRLELAKKFVIGAAQNILKNLKYYNSPSRTSRNTDSWSESAETRNSDEAGSGESQNHVVPGLSSQIDTIEGLMSLIGEAKEISELMAIEGNIRQVYYTAFEPILGYDYEFKKRVKRPPNNSVNALISFSNSMVYTAVLSEIYKTQLSPLVSYLHEPGERRFSLALDIAEIFKPILADRLIFKVLNKGMINESDFDKRLNYAYLKDRGRKVFVKEFDDRMQTTIKHRGLGRSVSYRTLIKLECYKLVKHLLGEKGYEPFQIWW